MFYLHRSYRFFAALLALILILLVIATGLALVWVPWYQSVPGQGKVTVFTASDRAQQVDAQIAGRVVQWYVREGQAVKKGQKLVMLQDLDSKFLDPLRVQRSQQIVAAYEQKREGLLQRIQALQSQQAAISEMREAALPAAQQRLAQAHQRRTQNEMALQLGEQNLTTDQLQWNRIEELERQGLRSRRDLELARQSLVKSQTELGRSRVSLNMATRDIEIARLDLERLQANYRSDLAKIRESLSKAQEDLAEIEASRVKAEGEAANQRQRQNQQVVVAPRDGRVVRLLQLGEGETVKVGDALCSLMPSVEDAATELYISGFDAPLVHAGQRVRLMFEGFPAIPFTAVPWAAVGTFGGRVAVVDACDDGSGRYRVLVVPEKEPGDIPWPSSQEQDGSYPLRPGTQAQGWIMMGQPVPLYWELWRRLNAFPPVPPAKEGKSKPYAPKPILKRPLP